MKEKKLQLTSQKYKKKKKSHENIMNDYMSMPTNYTT